MDAAGDLYPGTVMHRRLVAPLYRFTYRVFYVLLDIDRIHELHRTLRLFSYNRFNLVSFHDRDHGSGRPGGLRRWIEGVLAAKGIALEGGRVRLLCLPRVFGFVFNPISLWYCEHRDGRLRAVLAEVRNTFGERHCYLLASGGEPLPYDTVQEKSKCFHVSPLLGLAGRYRFRLSEPGPELRIVINEFREQQPVLDATLAGKRRELTDKNLLVQVSKMPAMTLKVVAAIHWQALKIWLRGARFHRKPDPPAVEVS